MDNYEKRQYKKALADMQRLIENELKDIDCDDFEPFTGMADMAMNLAKKSIELSARTYDINDHIAAVVEAGFTVSDRLRVN